MPRKLSNDIPRPLSYDTTRTSSKEINQKSSNEINQKSSNEISKQSSKDQIIKMNDKMSDAPTTFEEGNDMVEKAQNILNTMSNFEETTAEYISNMLVHFTNNDFQQGTLHAKGLVINLEVFFLSLEAVHDQLLFYKQNVNYSDVKELVKKTIDFFSTLSSKKIDSDRQKSAYDMIHIVTSLAYTLKVLIGDTLSSLMKLEQTYRDKTALQLFLDRLESAKDIDEKAAKFSQTNDLCRSCNDIVEDECFCTIDDQLIYHSKCCKCAKCDKKATFYNKSAIFCKTHAPSDSLQLIRKSHLTQ